MGSVFQRKRVRDQASGTEDGSDEGVDEICLGMWQIMAKCVRQASNMMRYVETHRLRFRRATAAFRFKRGQIQASGAEDG